MSRAKKRFALICGIRVQGSGLGGLRSKHRVKKHAMLLVKDS